MSTARSTISCELFDGNRLAMMFHLDKVHAAVAGHCFALQRVNV